MLFRISFIVFVMLPFFGTTQGKDSVYLSETIQEVQIIGLNAHEKTPVTFTNIDKEELETKNLGQDLPYLISLTPSVISSSDAGAGIGYTYMSIRGSDASRINVTINGIPINDSESQGVWWVNMPDFTSSVNNIQIQRGVGTSTNGGSAFGATVNLETNGLRSRRYLTSSNTVGSFNTLKNNIEFGSGLINKRWAIDGRISKITSDGYIDRASSDLKSIYLSGGYYANRSSVKGVLFSGHERTYQAWYGVPQRYLDSNRTFNPYNYEDEVDDYMQTHLQLHYNKEFNESTFLDIATHYTKGGGYYQQYIGENQNSILYNGDYIFGQNNLSFYGLEDTVINLIRRKWLDNKFYGMTFNFSHRLNKANIILGGAANTYKGDHFGKVIFTEVHGDIDHEYYRNEATKDDAVMYLKLNYNLTNKLFSYIDLQSRLIDYNFEGYDEDGDINDQEINLRFFNPKYGIHYSLTKQSSFYASFSEGKKEPNRDDYIESSPNSRPKPETLYDTEIGYRYKSKQIIVGLNFYNMDYKNQLINTGEINDVGASIRSNIDESFRRGIEIESSIMFSNSIKWTGNITVSKNRIVEHTEYIDNWDTWDKDIVQYKDTDISFSPNLIAKSQIHYSIGNINCSWIFKHVGNQYMDNTQSSERMINAYNLNDILISYKPTLNNIKITLAVNNILNKEYENRAWIYKFNSTSETADFAYDPYINKDSDGFNMIGYFPQARRSYLLGITLSF